MRMRTFAPGAAVEVNLGAEDSSDIWYPATVVKENRLGYVVKYKRSDEAGFLTEVVDSRHVRPSPPVCPDTKFQLLEKVDAFCNFGWSSGVLTKILSEGRYIVYFKSTRKEKEFKHNDLRLPMVQFHNRWMLSSQDAGVINPGESKDITHGENGKISALPEISDVVANGKGNVQKEQALPSGKASFDSKSVSSVGIEGVTENELLRDRTSKELDTESLPKELQSSPDESETQMSQMTPIEQLDQPETLDVPISDLKVDTCKEQSENGNEAYAKSANSGKKLKRRGPGRPRRSDSGKRKTSAGVVAAKTKPVADSSQSYIQQPIVISLPCSNSLGNKLHAQNPSKLPIADQEEVQDGKKQLPYFVSDVSTVKDVNPRNPPDVKGLKKGNSAPKRKRGRPFGSLSGVKRKINEAAETLTALDSARRSTRERKEVFKSATDTLKPKGKKLKATNEILSSTLETEANLEEKAKGVITYTFLEYVEPVPHGFSGNVSDDDRPLSTWFGEAHSLPYTKLSPGGNAGESGNIDLEVGQMSIVECNKETSEDNAADLSPSDNKKYGTTENDEEKLIGIAVNSLPFVKASPIWKVIESMEIFQQIPQNPHFQPLYDTKEHCREGLAICSMVTFSRLAEGVSNFQFDSPINMLEDSMETLLDLETQGFSVELLRNRLNALLSIKRKHDQSQSLAKEIDEEKKEKDRIDLELDEIDQKIAELREKRALIVLKRVEKYSKIGELQSRFNPVKDALEEARSEFNRIANAPW